jgi:hypothetical protein
VTSPRSGFVKKGVVARNLNVCGRTIEVWARDGIIPSIKLNNRLVRYHWPSIETALLARQTTKGGPGMRPREKERAASYDRPKVEPCATTLTFRRRTVKPEGGTL